MSALESRAKDLGVAGIFAKPFDIPTLLRYVATTLARDTGRPGTAIQRNR